MLVFLGWLGAILLALCSIPEAYNSIMNGHSKGLSWTFILMWYFGEIFVLIPVAITIKEKYLLFNYILNIIGISIIIYYKLIGG